MSARADKEYRLRMMASSVAARKAGDPAGAAPEGVLAAPEGQVVEALNGLLNMKYQMDAAYRSFADRLRGPWRDSLVAHWQEHAGDERKQAYDLAMKVMGLGGDPAQTSILVPACPADLASFGTCLIRLELQAIQAARLAMEASGSMDSLRVLLEEVLLKDTHHLDDLRRMLTGTC